MEKFDDDQATMGQPTRVVPKLRLKRGEDAATPIGNPLAVKLVIWLRFIPCREKDRNPAEVVLHSRREKARGEITLFRVFPPRLPREVALS